MKVLAFCGSPRKAGNTRTLLDEVARGVADAGGKCEILDIAAMNIAPCREHARAVSALAGARRGKDMDGLATRSRRLTHSCSHASLLLGPVCADEEAFVDRWYSIVHGPDFRLLKGKKAAVVTPYADDEPSTAQHTVGMFETAFKYLGLEFAGALGVTAGKEGEVRNDARAMEQAFALGQSLARG